MSKHTPGPWTQVQLADGNYLVVGGAVENYPVGICTTTEEPSDEENEANAALIAAAPDLLCAASAAAFCLRIGGDYPNALAVLEDAIARAEGREP